MRQLAVQEIGKSTDSFLSRLIHCITNFLVLPGWRTSWRKSVRIETIPTDQAVLLKQLEPFSGAAAVDVVLGNNLVLQKIHKLPRKARPQSQKILSLRADALNTAAQGGLLAVSKLSERGKREDVYTQYLVRRDDLRRLQTTCDALGVRLRKISCKSGDNDVVLVDNRKKIDRPLRRWWVLLTLLVSGICAGSLWHAEGKIQEQNMALLTKQTILADLQSALDDVLNTTEANEQAGQRLALVLTALETGQTGLQELASLSSVLGDETWISQFLSNGDGLVRLDGITTSDVIDIIATLEAEDWVDSVTLGRPVRNDTFSGVTSFELNVQRRMPVQP